MLRVRNNTPLGMIRESQGSQVAKMRVFRVQKSAHFVQERYYDALFAMDPVKQVLASKSMISKDVSVRWWLNKPREIEKSS